MGHPDAQHAAFCETTVRGGRHSGGTVSRTTRGARRNERARASLDTSLLVAVAYLTSTVAPAASSCALTLADSSFEMPSLMV